MALPPVNGVEFKGGDGLERALDGIIRRLGTGDDLRVGFLEGSKYPDGTLVAQVAAIQNFGAPAASIPARPFFSDMVRDKSPAWGKELASVLKAANYDARVALERMGARIAAQLQQSIVDTYSPPLSPVTLMLRSMFWSNPGDITGKAVGIAAAKVAAGESNNGASTKPLVWTGHLLQSVAYEVQQTARFVYDTVSRSFVSAAGGGYGA